MIDTASVFLDANILLHYPPPDQIHWPDLCGAGEVLLVIYPLLLTELSKAKDLHRVAAIRRRAREREVWVKDRLKSSDVPVRSGVRLLRDSQEPRMLLVELGLDSQVQDDMIIAHAVSYRRRGYDVFVATADGGLGMKLEDHEIAVITLEDSLRLPVEPDPEKIRADNAERELRALRSRLPSLKLWPKGAIVLTRQPDYGDLIDFVQQHLLAADEAYKREQLQRSRAGHLPPSVDTLFAQRYLPEREAASDSLRQRYRWIVSVEHAKAVQLIVKNDGSAPATNVRVRLFVPIGLTASGPGSCGPPPQRLSMSAPFKAVYHMAHSVQTEVPEFVPMLPRGDGVPIVDAQARTIEIHWSRLAHDDQKTTAPFYLTAASNASIGRTALRTSVLCDEMASISPAHIPVEIENA